MRPVWFHPLLEIVKCLDPEKKPVNRVAFYHLKGLFFDICVYMCGRCYFLSFVGFFPHALRIRIHEILPRMIESVWMQAQFMWESVFWGRMVIKHKGILYRNIKICMSYIFTLQIHRPVNKISLGQEGTCFKISVCTSGSSLKCVLEYFGASSNLFCLTV